MLDPSTAWDRAQLAGEAHAKAHNRTAWDESDYDYAASVLDRLMDDEADNG